jgi:hypothetical protein
VILNRRLTMPFSNALGARFRRQLSASAVVVGLCAVAANGPANGSGEDHLSSPFSRCLNGYPIEITSEPAPDGAYFMSQALLSRT